MARPKSNTVNRPSQSDREYIKVDGVLKRNRAYDKSKDRTKRGPAIKPYSPSYGNEPVSDAVKKVIDRNSTKSRLAAITGDSDLAVEIDGDTAYIDDDNLTYVFMSDTNNFAGGSNFTYTIVDKDGEITGTGEVGEYHENQTLSDVVEHERMSKFVEDYPSGFLDTLDTRWSSHSNYPDYTADDGFNYSPGRAENLGYSDYHSADIGYVEKPQMIKITDREEFTRSYMGGKYGSSNKEVSKALISKLDDIGFYDESNWYPNIENHYYGDEFNGGFAPNDGLLSKINELNTGIQNEFDKRYD